jgi:DNA polymerase elongation subunit (family B)
MYLWEQINDKNEFNIINWVPYVYEPDESKSSKIHTIDGIPVNQKRFFNIKDYQDYQKSHKHSIFENEVPKDIQFLAERYYHIPDDDIKVPKLNIYSIDIEVHSDAGFPKASEAFFPVVLINVRGFNHGVNISWGLKEYTGENNENVEYHQCSDERQLLTNFFDWWHKNSPDVVTGWNIVADAKTNRRGGFDFPYIINRSKNLFGRNTTIWHKLSPISVVRCWDDKETGAMNVNIAGVSIIDYLALYKWYTPKNPENYKLDTIAMLELDEGKLDYSQYENLKTLYEQDFNLYVDYNVIDNKRIDQLEEKLGYIRLAQNLSLLCHCQMENYNSSVALIEGLMLTHYRRNDLCAPRIKGGHQQWFPAAFVKDPSRGQYDWIVDLDIASSYPTAIITLNMSPETYYGRIISYRDVYTDRTIDIYNGRDEMNIEDVARLETPIVEFTRKRKFPPFTLLKDPSLSDSKGKQTTSEISGEKLEKFNKALEKGLLTIAPCGSIFYQHKKGHFSQVELETYKKRSVVKGLMKEARLKASRARNPDRKKEHETKANNLFALQWAIKIVLNSAYGVTGVPYSRYFNIHLSEAIASCGRRAIVDGEHYVNRWFREKKWTEENVLSELSKLGDIDTTKDIQGDLVAYIDTDSVFIKVGEFIDQLIGFEWKTQKSDEEITEIILNVSKIIENYVNDCAYIETQLGGYNSRMNKDIFSIVFKQEIVCKSALFIQKKKYGYHVVNNEGVPCDEIDVTGLEIIRSETPSVFREALKDMLGMILRNEEDNIILESYNKYKKIAKTAYTEEISENKGIKGLEKYVVDGECIKGTPYHVKAAAAYNKLIKELNVNSIYPEIEDESKNKLVYVKPNPYRIDCIMYDRWVKEFESIGIEPDRDKMIDKFLTQKLLSFLEPAKKEHILEQNQSFNAFFG